MALLAPSQHAWQEDLDAVQIESSHTIEIDAFVPREDIDERYFEKPYYIAPDGKTGIDAFAVIRDAMKRQDKAALARIVLTNREHVIALRPLDKGLLGTTLRYPYELRDDGTMLNKTEYLKNGEVTGGREVLYKEAPGAEVHFK